MVNENLEDIDSDVENIKASVIATAPNKPHLEKITPEEMSKKAKHVKVEESKVYKTEVNVKDDQDDSVVFGFCDDNN